jgi:hypothetical protein
MGAAAQPVACFATESNTEDVGFGISLTWDSAFVCEELPTEGSYTLTVNVANDDEQRTVQMNRLVLFMTTPPLEGGMATAEAAGLPLELGPGETGTITVTGDYALVKVAHGEKLNVHLRMEGQWSAYGFRVGLNTQLLGVGFVYEDDEDEEEEEEEDDNGPPPWAGGPPPWAGRPPEDRPPGPPIKR